MSEQVTFDEGKYTIKIEDDDSVVLLRWGEMWDDHPSYPKMLIAILYEFQELQERLEKNPDYCDLWSKAVEHGEGLLEEKCALESEKDKLLQRVKELDEPAAEHTAPEQPDITDAEVEAAARAIYMCDWSKDGFQDPECVWDEEGPEYQQLYLDEARAALLAARKVRDDA